MPNKIVEDGRARLEATPEFQQDIQQKAAAIRAEYADLIRAAKGLERLQLWWRMRLELRKLRPSDQTLWLVSVQPR